MERVPRRSGRRGRRWGRAAAAQMPQTAAASPAITAMPVTAASTSGACAAHNAARIATSTTAAAATDARMDALKIDRVRQRRLAARSSSRMTSSCCSIMRSCSRPALRRPAQESSSTNAYCQRCCRSSCCVASTRASAAAEAFRRVTADSNSAVEMRAGSASRGSTFTAICRSGAPLRTSAGRRTIPGVWGRPCAPTRYSLFARRLLARYCADFLQERNERRDATENRSTDCPGPRRRSGARPSPAAHSISAVSPVVNWASDWQPRPVIRDTPWKRTSPSAAARVPNA